MPDEILEALDPEQRAVATAVSGPVVVWAGAGTGKTRAITHRIAHAVRSGAHEAGATLAVTFTTRAAAEMRERLHRLGVDGVSVQTFHAAALRQLRHFWPRHAGGMPPTVLARPGPVVAEAAAACRIPASAALVRDLVGEIAWAKQSQIGPDDYAVRAPAAGRALSIEPVEVARIFGVYDDLTTERHLADFDDVLLYSAALLDRYPQAAGEVHDRYRWFTVDEFQDVSPLQHRLLDLWLGERTEVCVVGDAAQTIYTFAGASDRFLHDFPARFPGATQVRLVRNYRSTAQICEVANATMAGTTLVSQVGAGPEPVVLECEDDPAEAEAIAIAIQALVGQGTSPREIAILVRGRGQLPLLEEACAARGIPLILRGGERFFDRPEVKEAITRVRGAARAGESGADLVGIVIATLSAMGFTAEPPRGSGAVRERWESLAALVSLAGELPPHASLTDLVVELDRRRQAQHSPMADAVTLSTIHAAKGLEWDAVFVAGLAEGLLPSSPALGNAEAEAEERRLYYVAITRARRHLHLSWSPRRTPGGRAQRRPSRFIAERLAPTPADEPRRPRRRGPSTCRRCHRALVTAAERTLGRCRGCPGGADAELVEALREWRRSTAHDRGVPAYVILTDASLVALAEQRPGDEEGLLAISGIGPDKVRRYGAELLALVAGEGGGGSAALTPTSRHADDAPET